MSGNNNAERDAAGVTVTLEPRAGGDPVSIHRAGLVSAALPAALDLFDASQWRVVTISTPRTILQDLHGRADRAAPYRRRAGGPLFARRHVQTPEAHLLGRVRRLEYL